MPLTIRNWQRSQKVDLPLLRRIVGSLLASQLKFSETDLGIFLVAAPEMTRLNENFLRHAGSTDVITFDYLEGDARKQKISLHGEIFVCVDESIVQARKFRTSWQAEIVRYIVHGVLHLAGHDDVKTALRRKMKIAENKLLARLAAEFDFRRLDIGRRAPRLKA